MNTIQVDCNYGNDHNEKKSQTPLDQVGFGGAVSRYLSRDRAISGKLDRDHICLGVVAPQWLAAVGVILVGRCKSF